MRGVRGQAEAWKTPGPYELRMRSGLANQNGVSLAESPTAKERVRIRKLPGIRMKGLSNYAERQR